MHVGCVYWQYSNLLATIVKDTDMEDSKQEQTAPVAATENLGNYVLSDEDILAYEKKVKADADGFMPLVGEPIPTAVIREEYDTEKDATIKATLDEFLAKNETYRTIKKDGNCFYRAYAFRLLELVYQDRYCLPEGQNPKERGQWGLALERRLDSTKGLLEEQGYSIDLLIDFYNVIVELLHLEVELESEGNGSSSLDKAIELSEILVKDLSEENTESLSVKGELYLSLLYRKFSEQHVSDAIVSYMRIIIGCELLRASFVYGAFVGDLDDDSPGPGEILRSFVSRDVIPMDIDADDVQVTAAANVLGVTIGIVSIIHRSGKLQEYDVEPGLSGMPLSAPEGVTFGQKKVHLLFRPGHYEILYQK